RRPGIGQRQPGADGDASLPDRGIASRRPVQAGRPAMTRLLTGMLLASVALVPAMVEAAAPPLSTRSSFRLGEAGVLCTAQIKPTDPRLSGIFDRGYQLTCRDAAAPVGSVLAVRRAVDLAREASALPVGALNCRAEEAAVIDGVGAVRAITCRDE